MSEEKHELVLIDGHAMLYRAFYAYPQTLTTRQGELINAAYGFTNILLSVLDELKPYYLAVSFDVGETWRHREYEEYKAHREKMPDELREQEPRVYEVLEALSVPVHTKEGFEADDVIGTMATRASLEQTPAIVVTGDMDMLQLVHDKTDQQDAVVVYRPGRGGKQTKIFDEAGVKEKYSLTPQQIIEYKALAGDSSDNIPGVRGVGPKTANKLLARMPTVEAIYEELDAGVPHHDDLIKGALKNRLEEHREIAFESKKLVTIVTDVEMDFNLEACALSDYNKDEARELFEQLEFRTLIDKLPDDAFEVAVEEALF